MNTLRNPAILFLLGCCFYFFLCFQASAESELDAQVRDRIRQGIEAFISDDSIINIQPTPLHNIYQVQIGLDLIYIDGDGRFALRGDLLDLQDKLNLTENWKKRQRGIMLKRMPQQELIEFAPEQAHYTIYAFTDVQCGYCRTFHRDVPELNRHGIAVRYLAFPVIGDPSFAHQLMESVWCAKDPKQALTQAKKGVQIEPLRCDNPVSRHLQLGREFGITGTPAIYSEDGTQLGGYLVPQELIKILQQQAL